VFAAEHDPGAVFRLESHDHAQVVHQMFDAKLVDRGVAG
jgi:hypothetical protein